MPRGGSKPGERRGGRQKGSLNKLSIGRMKAQLAVSAPEFDPYDQLEIIAKTFLERVRADDDPRWRSPEASHGFETGFENGSAAEELRDAHDCIVVRSL
jgi:hypothetical protein